MIRPLPAVLLAVVVLAATTCATCARVPREAGPNAGGDGVAIHGYDPVAYHVDGAAVRGDPAIAAEHAGATWRFASEANREKFRAGPERYAPAYGGWCAWAMADGEFVDVDPASFLIEDGRLLLFYDGIWGDTRAMWREEPKPAQADAAWGGLRGSEAP